MVGRTQQIGRGRLAGKHSSEVGMRGKNVPWSWRYERSDGSPADVPGLAEETWTTQADAESWVGENWRSLLELGVDQVTLCEDGRQVYGPMSLHPPGEEGS